MEPKTVIEPRPSPSRNRYRILALDVDGTLLDPTGTLRPRTAATIARASAAGLRPVLCTGRRYGRVRALSRQLNLGDPLVCNSGALLRAHDSGPTLWRADFGGPLFSEIVAIFRRHDQPMVGFIDGGAGAREFVVRARSTGRPGFDEYVDLNARHAEVDPDWADRPPEPGREPFHVCAVGTRPEMLAFEAEVHRGLDGRVRTFVQKSPRYQGWMCEVIRADASKWAALLQLAALWGVPPSEIVAVGDDRNDVPMIEGAGLGVVMGHAPPEVIAVADHVAADNASDGLAEFLEDVLLPGLDDLRASKKST